MQVNSIILYRYNYPTTALLQELQNKQELNLPQFLSSLPSEHPLIPLHRIMEAHWPLLHRNSVELQPICTAYINFDHADIATNEPHQIIALNPSDSINFKITHETQLMLFYGGVCMLYKWNSPLLMMNIATCFLRAFHPGLHGSSRLITSMYFG